MAIGGNGPRLTQSAQQQQLMLPKMLQAIELLQLPSMELSTWLREAFESNAALVVEEPEGPPRPTERNVGPRARTGASDRHAEWLASQEAQGEHWREGVLEQLGWLDLRAATAAWAGWLVDRLDGDGLLTDSDEALLTDGLRDGLPGGLGELADAIAALQRLEPRGLGGRDATEALLLQLEPADPDYGRLCALIERFLDEVYRNKLPQVAKRLGLDVGEINRLVGRLGELQPRPIAAVETESVPSVAPDVVVLALDGAGFAIEFPRSHLPTVALDPELVGLATDRAQPKEVRAYARGKVGEARALIDALDQRQATLERVARTVFAHQHAYLEQGPSALTPLSMTDVADELELHVSTISRAVAGKYAQTPWGIEPLRRFFQASAGGGEGQGSAADEVRERVRVLFAGEDPAAPLSDDEAVARLAAGGVHLARRTVAKYRQELGIPSSYRRRRFN
ncbi:RNA polymerase factor sigma-54 [Engelhardtia mirabilis]|uniref:RNA polymerase sigma-54 factor n=1 Tax=Engelhardtia mirabilis TaxID=2528011 RepID=A0A518BPA2_9BACT|nr:RNA polymerase sigma-54 factor [Planctomycetes bacterium Pla133]QDV03134.1 RNA polymerase sigma-54 factor [Planctomycetes bacterium Pla86]